MSANSNNISEFDLDNFFNNNQLNKFNEEYNNIFINKIKENLMMMIRNYLLCLFICI